MTYLIGQTAEKLGINPSTLRYYDKEGLLPFVQRSEGGIRQFCDTDFEWIRLIECLKSTGMPIKDIKQFIDWYIQGDSTLEKRRDMFYERKTAVQKQLEEVKKTLEIINYKCWYYDTAIIAKNENIRTEDIEMPEEIRQYKKRLVTGI